MFVACSKFIDAVEPRTTTGRPYITFAPLREILRLLYASLPKMAAAVQPKFLPQLTAPTPVEMPNLIFGT